VDEDVGREQGFLLGFVVGAELEGKLSERRPIGDELGLLSRVQALVKSAAGQERRNGPGLPSDAAAGLAIYNMLRGGSQNNPSTGLD
jgi:hypothetical protein